MTVQTAESNFTKATTRLLEAHSGPHSTPMEFFEGKRVRKLRSTYEDALEKTLEPQTLEVRPPTLPHPISNYEKGDYGKDFPNANALGMPDLPKHLPPPSTGVLVRPKRSRR